MLETKLSREEIKKMREEYLLPSTMTYFKEPIAIVRGEMQYVFDDEGKKYLDAFGAVVTISVGHCHPDVVAAVIEQTKTLQHMTTLYYHPIIVLYAKKLAEKSPGDLKVSFFTNSGCEANELAAILAKNYTKTHEFIALTHSFHGRTLMAMALTGQSLWRHSIPYAYGVSHAPAAYCYRCPYDLTYPSCKVTCARQVEQIVKYSTTGKIAAFIAEPMQGFGGVTLPPKEYFPIIYEIVKKYGGLFISDEVQTGFGRTGRKFFGIEQWGVQPDIITMAKGIGNGIPLGGVITTKDVAESMRGKVHFNTYAGNPVSMTQGLKVLEVIDKYNYSENAFQMGNLLIEGLNALKAKHHIIGDVRGMGLMIGVELVRNRATKEPASTELLEVMDKCKERGLLIGKGGMAGNVFRIKPPMCITRDDVEFILKTLDEVLGDYKY
ncbi:MAG: aspartate aminotransferase family protein [Candidatus Eremiobacteraeota bacterium]|nr:aspartate aminotransferase family protein [Candidatus Eremiobacteraeota bacterium]